MTEDPVSYLIENFQNVAVIKWALWDKEHLRDYLQSLRETSPETMVRDALGIKEFVPGDLLPEVAVHVGEALADIRTDNPGLTCKAALVFIPLMRERSYAQDQALEQTLVATVALRTTDPVLAIEAAEMVCHQGGDGGEKFTNLQERAFRSISRSFGFLSPSDTLSTVQALYARSGAPEGGTRTPVMSKLQELAVEALADKLAVEGDDFALNTAREALLWLDQKWELETALKIAPLHAQMERIERETLGEGGRRATPSDKAEVASLFINLNRTSEERDRMENTLGQILAGMPVADVLSFAQGARAWQARNVAARVIRVDLERAKADDAPAQARARGREIIGSLVRAPEVDANLFRHLIPEDPAEREALVRKVFAEPVRAETAPPTPAPANTTGKKGSPTP